MSVIIEQPSYYDDFKCIADKCDFTCCRDWTIAVDEVTYESWKSKVLPGSMAKDSFMDNKKVLADLVEENDASKRIVLDNGRCPFLDCNGLCHIVSKYGEEGLSKTCHTYPRETIEFTNNISGYRLRNLTLSCKTAIHCLFDEDKFRVVSNSVDNDSIVVDENCPQYLITLQQWFYTLVDKYKEVGSADILKTVFYILLDLIDQETDGDISEEKARELIDLYKKEENLSSIINTITNPDNQTDLLERFIEDNELLMDLFIRYYEQDKYSEFIKPIYDKAEELEGLIEDGKAIELYSEYISNIGDKYENKIKLIIAEELWSSLIVSYYDIETMAVKVQWLAIELALLKHYMFIHYSIFGHLSEEELVQIVAILFRTTGYCDDDIIEYLEASFEDIVWEWGYMDLII